ncbi:MAG: hypothetical protein GY820_42740 [Gammaproteobacteria bacterium]|nr:hypothetical protein [Gammaproteobacteria bacterium]
MGDKLNPEEYKAFIEVNKEQCDAVTSKLKEYNTQCPGLDISQHRTYNVRLLDYILTLPEEEQKKLGEGFEATDNFKLFQLSGFEAGMLFYAESYRSLSRDVYSNGGYTLFDLSECKSIRVVGTIDPLDRDFAKKRLTETVHAPFKFNDDWYIYTRANRAVERFKFHQINFEKRRAPIMCAYEREL